MGGGGVKGDKAKGDAGRENWVRDYRGEGGREDKKNVELEM